MNFDPRIALEYAGQFARPRQVGTRQEIQVAREIAGQLNHSGYSVKYQDFEFSTAFERFLTLEILTGLLLIAVCLLTSGTNRWFTLIPTGLLISLVLLISPLNRKVQGNSVKTTGDEHPTFWSRIVWKLGAFLQTKNIVAELSGTPLDIDIPHLYLVAHYDSKSQHLPLVLRIALFLIVISGTILFSILNLISLVNASFEPALLVIGILVLICGIPLLFLDYGNKSPGAIDNASGVGLVLHLAEILAVYPGVGGKLNIRVLITGAEELGVKGALAYLQQNAAALRNLAQRGGLQVLNFDGIGVDGKLYVVGSDPSPSQANGTDLYHLVRQSAGELGIPLGRFLLPGAMFDHIPFAEEGYDALSLVGVGKGSSSVHTSGDSPEKLHIKGFDQAGRLALRVVEKYCGEQINQE
ncbi:MAG: M28 family metallopeptidase [Anaerolineales bacterium]|jgi:hypothetical protein